MISAIAATRGLVGVSRISTAVLVTYVFIVLLMTVSAQQSVDALLKQQDATYSSATAGLRDVTAWEARRDQADSAIEETRRTADKATGEFQSAADAYKLGGELFNAFVGDAASPKCPLVPIGDINDTRPWYTANRCYQAGRLSPEAAKEFKELLTSTSNLEKLATAWRRAGSAEDNAKARFETAIGWRKEIEAAKPKEIKYKATFSELDIFKRNWWLLGRLTTDFSPALLQILLALASGAFGALLITLVFIVYPKNALTVSKGEGFGARILLGGLISVCTYIVLSGGATILGANSAFNQGQTNFMTFCAVGVLAGMFSDRVAAWLSERANLVFKQGDPPPIEEAKDETKKE